MVRAGGSASRTSGDSETTDPGGGGRAALATRNRLVWMSPVGHAHDFGWSPSVQGFPPLGSHVQVASPGERERGKRKTHVLAQPVVGQTVCRDCFPLCLELGGLGGRCRRLGGNSRSPKKLNHDLVVTGNDMVSGGEMSVVEKFNGYSGDLAGQRQDQDAPLPGDQLNSRPACGPSVGAVRTNRQKGYRNSVPPQDVTGEAFELDNAAVLTPAIHRAASSSVFAGAVAPADFAGIPFPAITGMELPAVAEDLSLANDVGGLPPAVCVSEPLRSAAGAGPLPDVEVTPSVELWGPVGPTGARRIVKPAPDRVLLVYTMDEPACAG